MALARQLVDVPFTGGLSTKLEGVLVDKARLLQASNLSVNAKGTLARRDAWLGLSGGTGINPIELATLGGELLAVDGATNNLYAYSPTAQAVASRGQVPFFQLSKLQVARSVGAVAGLDSASTGSKTAYVWLQYVSGAASGVYLSIYDEVGKTFILNGAQVTASANDGAPRVCVVDANTFLVAHGQSTNVLMATYNATTGASTHTATVATDFVGTASNSPLEICALGNGQTLLAYASTKAATSIGALVVNSSLSVIAAEITAASNAFSNIYCIALAVFPNTSTSIGLYFKPKSAASATAILSWDGVSTLAVAHAAGGTGLPAGSAGGNVGLVWTGSAMQMWDFPFQGGPGVVACSVATLSTGNAVSGSTTIVNSMQSSGGLSGPYMAGKPFLTNGATYLPVAMTSNLQPGLFLMDSAGRLQAVALYGSLAATSSASTVGVIFLASGYQPTCPLVGTTQVRIPAAQQSQLSLTNGTNTTVAGVVSVSLTPGRNGALPLWHAQAGNCLYFSGSYLAMYDGGQVAEAGFLYFPENVAATPVAGTGAVSGTYQVVAVFEWVDNQGQRHQSAPSIPVSFTLASASHSGVTVSACTLLFGKRAANATVVFYRTAANGTTFYRINPPNAALANTTGAASVSYTDSSMTSPDPISGNEILYTTSGYLPNDNPPACNAIATWQNRLVYSNAEDGQDIRFSQYPQTQQGLYFNETLLFTRTNQSAGLVTGLAVLDDKLVVGTATNKFWISGGGPTSAGLNGSFSSPQLLPSDVGFLDQRSIALVPDVGVEDGPLQEARPGGLIHQTNHGLYLLDRSLVDRAVGFPVDAYASGNTITSATVLQDKGQLRLTVSGASGASVIVYDYLWGQWETFTSSVYSPQCGAVWGGLWTSGDASAGLIQDSLGAYLDGGSRPITWTLKTAWLKLSSLQGFERVHRVVLFGSYSGPSTLSASASQDYSTFTAGTLSPILGVTSGFLGGISEATANLLTSDGLRWQVRWHQENQKVEAVQFTLSDTPTGGNWGGVNISGLTLELGMKRGTTKKLPAQQSA